MSFPDIFLRPSHDTPIFEDFRLPGPHPRFAMIGPVYGPDEEPIGMAVIEPRERLLRSDVLVYKRIPVEVCVIEKIMTPFKSCILMCPDRAFVRVCNAQLDAIAQETGANIKQLEGAVVHHELGHLEGALRHVQYEEQIDAERAAWHFARTEVPFRLPRYWGGISADTYMLAELWGLGSYDGEGYDSSRRIWVPKAGIE